MNSRIHSILGALFLAAASHAEGAIVIGNLPHGFFNGTSSISQQANKAVSFTIAPGGDYRLTDASLVTVGLDATTPSGGGDLPNVFIATNVGGSPGVSLGSLINPTAPVTTVSEHNWLAPTADIILEADETYWLVVSETQGSWNWLADNENEQPTTTDIGATFEGYQVTADGGLTWSNSSSFNPVQINAVQHNPAGVPEPSSSLVSLALLFGCLAYRRR